MLPESIKPLFTGGTQENNNQVERYTTKRHAFKATIDTEQRGKTTIQPVVIKKWETNK